MKKKKARKIVKPLLQPRQLWEILVPASDSSTGREHDVSFHQQWDARVEKISGGMTIISPAKGRWTYQGSRLEERMIPVRVLCSEAQINSIIDFTKRHYNQLTVMAYRISDRVILR